jgi:parallel beta-helix repeat protein
MRKDICLVLGIVLFTFILLSKPIDAPATYNATDFFTELKENVADIDHAYSIFILHNPSPASITVNMQNLNFYIESNFTKTNYMNISILRNVTHNESTVYYSYENCTNTTEIIPITKPYQICNLTKYTVWDNYTKEEFIPLSQFVNIMPNENITIKVEAYYRPSLNSNYRDWIPYINVPSVGNFSMPQWQWWNTSWTRCRNISIQNSGDYYKWNESVLVNLTGLTFSSANEIRIINDSCNNNGNGVAVPTEILNFSASTSGNGWAWVVFPDNNTSANSNVTYSVYYNYTLAPNPNYGRIWYNGTGFFDNFNITDSTTLPTQWNEFTGTGWDASINNSMLKIISVPTSTGNPNVKTVMKTFNITKGIDLFVQVNRTNDGLRVKHRLYALGIRWLTSETPMNSYMFDVASSNYACSSHNGTASGDNDINGLTNLVLSNTNTIYYINWQTNSTGAITYSMAKEWNSSNQQPANWQNVTSGKTAFLGANATNSTGLTAVVYDSGSPQITWYDNYMVRTVPLLSASESQEVTLDITLPVYSLNQTNSTVAGTPILHSLNWTDNIGLSGYIFSFYNGSNTIATYNWTSPDQESSTRQFIASAIFLTTGNMTPQNWGKTSNGWFNWTNITVSDNKRAWVTTVSGSEDWYNFGFGIPSNSTIYGIIGYFEHSTNASSTCIWIVNISNNNGSSYKPAVGFTAPISNGDVNGTMGSFTSLYGLSWSPATVNGSGGLMINTTKTQSTAARRLQLDTFVLNINYSSPNQEVNSSWAPPYSGIDGSDYQNVDKVGIDILINTYDPSASNSTYDNNNAPDIEVGIYNGTSYINGSLCHINDTMGDNLLNTTAWNCWINITGTNNITDAWERQANRSVIIRGLWLDTYNTTIDDEINVTAVYGYIDAWNNYTLVNDTWVAFGEDTWSNVTKIVNYTTGALIRWCVYANDTTNNWNSTSCSSPFNYLTTEGVPATSISQCSILSLNNSYYILTGSFTDVISNPCINITGFNDTFDCQGNSITGNKSNYGIETKWSSNQNTNNTIMNCNMTYWNSGIIFFFGSNNSVINNTVMSSNEGIVNDNGSTNNVIINNTAVNNTYGIQIWSNSANTVTNASVINNTVVSGNYYGIYMINSWGNSIANNTISSNSYGIYIDTSQNNTISGGSIDSSDIEDYVITGSGSSNNFTNTNFTSSRVINLGSISDYFNYNNQTNGNIWLKTNNINNNDLTRILTNWTQQNISWNESDSSSDIANYTITGLVPSATYQVYNFSVLSYTLNSGDSGEISFTIALNSTARRIYIFQSAAGIHYYGNWTEASTLGDLKAKNTSHIEKQADTVSVGDVKLKNSTYPRSLIDSIAMLDYFKRNVSVYRKDTELLSLVDLSSRNSSYFKKSYDLLTLAEIAARNSTYLRSKYDSLQLVDLAYKNFLFPRTAYDLLTFTDLVSKNFTYVKKTYDMSQIVDIAYKNSTSLRSRYDLETLVDLISRNLSYVKSNYDMSQLIDITYKNFVFTRVTYDLLTFMDMVKENPNYVENAFDITQMIDLAYRNSTYLKARYDLETLIDMIIKNYTYVRSTYNSEQLLDLAYKNFFFPRAVYDLSTLIDILSRNITYVEKMFDMEQIVDLAYKNSTYFRSSYDLETFMDLVSKNYLYMKSMYDSTQLIDLYFKNASYMKKTYDMSSLIDLIIRNSSYVRATYDLAQTISLIGINSSYFRTTYDSLSLIDKAMLMHTLSVYQYDSIQLFDSNSMTLHRMKSAEDVISFLDSASRNTTGNMSVSELFVYYDVKSGILRIIRNPQDAITFYDNLSRLLIANRKQIDLISMQDSYKTSKSLFRFPYDPLSMSDRAYLAAYMSRLATDGIVIIDIGTKSLMIFGSNAEAMSYIDYISSNRSYNKKSVEYMAFYDSSTRSLIMIVYAPDSLNLSDSTGIFKRIERFVSGIVSFFESIFSIHGARLYEVFASDVTSFIDTQVAHSFIIRSVSDSLSYVHTFFGQWLCTIGVSCPSFQVTPQTTLLNCGKIEDFGNKMICLRDNGYTLITNASWKEKASVGFWVVVPIVAFSSLIVYLWQRRR